MIPLRQRILVVHLFCVAVGIAGAAVLAVVVAGARDLNLADEGALLLAAGVVLGELKPLKLPLRDDDVEVNFSTSFAFALLLGFGLAPALLAQAVASIVQDTVSRKPWWRGAFNLGQYAISLAAAAAALRLAGLPPGEAPSMNSAETLLAVGAGGAVFFAVNFLTVGIAISLHHRIPLRRYLRSGVGFSAKLSAVLIALGPLVLSTQRQGAPLLLLFLVPLRAVYLGGRQAARSQFDATHDSLTGLPNRTRFHALVEDAIESAGEDGRFSVMVLDLDRFKDINDTLGHHYGDRALQKAGPRLRSAVPEPHVLARLGGDEFGVLVRDPERVDGIAAAVAGVLREPLDLDGFTVDLDASAGIAEYPAHGSDVHALLRSADVAMYRAKDLRVGHVRYEPEQDPHTPQRLALVSELRRALDAGDQLEVFYQPKLDLRQRRVVGAEALVRWRHPELGLLSPFVFIELAEQTGLIRPLTSAVLRQALSDQRAWRRSGHDIGVAVNLSTRSLLADDIVAEVEATLREHDGCASRLTLEVTESAIMSDPDTALRVIAELRSAGVTISIDDFGTGYSSLAYLRRLPASEIKIDRSFVQNLATEDGDAAIVRATIDLAEHLGLRTVAEGVEDVATLSVLDRLGCHEVQGYHLSRPQDAASFAAWLDGPGRTGEAWTVLGQALPEAA